MKPAFSRRACRCEICGDYIVMAEMSWLAEPQLPADSPPFAKRLRRGSLRLLRYDRVRFGLPSRSLRMSTKDGARLRPSGYAAAAFACFATIEFGLACRAVACEASEGWWARQGSN